MRKLVVFLLLLGTGLLVLWWLDRARAPTIVEDRPAEDQPPEVRPGAQEGGLTLGGRFRAQFYDETTQKTIFDVESEDSRSEQAADVLSDARITMLDPEAENEPQARLHAHTARIRRLGVGTDYRPLYENRVELESVQAEILSGTPIAPLTFTTPNATLDALDPRSRRVHSDAEFNGYSSELNASGQGFFIELDREILEVERNGWVELARPGQTPIHFRSRGDGELQVRRDPRREDSVVLQAWRGALFEAYGEDPSTLSAEYLVARAVPVDPAAGSSEYLRIERLEAQEDVRWESTGIAFRARRSATASFDAQGRLERAHLEGLPRARFVLQLDALSLPGLPEQELSEIELSGEQALDVHWEDGYRLEMAGLSSVETRDFRLRAAIGGVSGWLAVDQRSARFAASGGVTVESGRATLDAAAFDVALETDARGESLLSGNATGGARLEGTLPEGWHYTLTSPDGLRIERDARGWRVVESTRVEVSLTRPAEGAAEPETFFARADRVTDFDVATFSFLAQGAVQVRSPEYTAGGERLRVFAAEPLRFELEGAGDRPAFVDGPDGRASARRVEVDGDEYRAHGAVTARIQAASDDEAKSELYEIDAEELFFAREEEAGLLAGESLQTLRLEASGGVRASIDRDADFARITGERLSVVRQARLQEGAESFELGSSLVAEGDVDVELRSKELNVDLDCQRFELERGEGSERDDFERIVAKGDARFQGRAIETPEEGEGRELEFAGEGEVVTLEGDGSGSLEPSPFGRVALRGRLPVSDLPFRMNAKRVDFAPDRIEARFPELRLAGLRARAEALTASAESVELSGAVRISGQTPSNIPFTLDAGNIVVVGKVTLEEGNEGELHALRATENVDFRLGESVRARGSKLVAKRTTGLMRLEGEPATFDTPYAVIESDWVEFDPFQQLLVSSGPGRARSRALSQAPGPDAAGRLQESEWTLDFLSSGTLVELDSLVFVLQEPVFRTPAYDSTIRASWAVMWLDRELWKDLPGAANSDLLAQLRRAFGAAEVDPAGKVGRMLEIFRSNELSGLLREVYLEGPVEMLSGDEVLARADAIYIDAVAGHGWLAHATVNLMGDLVGQELERLIVKADWLRLSADGSLRADRATVTSCTYDEPHVRVVTGDLRILALEGRGEEHYRLLLDDNRVELYERLRIPLPKIDIATDEKFEPLLPTLSIADSARFGTLLGLNFTRPAEKAGEVFSQAVDKEDQDYDSHWKVDASYLGSRGGLLDIGLEIEGEKDYWFDLFLGLAYDTGDDKGYVRVDEEERDDLRRWLRSHLYFENGETAFSGVYSDQGDAGVQSEFYESQFVRYEQDETYLQWRRSDDEYFLQATGKVRVDSFRTDVEELPSLTAYRSRSPVLSIGDMTLIHTGDASAAYLRRREGSDPRSPFGLPTLFPDGLGNTEVLRFDTTQALELPLALGFAGLKLTPFAAARVSLWDEGVDPEDSPARFLADAGARLSTAFWKRGRGGALHQIVPSVAYRAEVQRTERDGVPVVYDEVERQVSGDLLELATRGRFGAVDGRSKFDVDLLGTYATDRSDGASDGWLPLELFSRLDVAPFGRDVEFFLDGRYDVENSETVYSLFAAATHVTPDLRIQAAHQRGRGSDRTALFEAATASGIYRWTEMWEFELRQGFSLLEDEELDSKFVIRRYGHDLVFEFESSYREGEGSSLGLSIRPRFGFEPPRIGYVPW